MERAITFQKKRVCILLECYVYFRVMIVFPVLCSLDSC